MSSSPMVISLNKIVFQVHINDKAPLQILLLYERQISVNQQQVCFFKHQYFKKNKKINKMSYFKYNVNPSKRVGMDGVLLGLAGLLLGISLGLRPWEIPWSSRASPRKTPFIPPLLLGLTHDVGSLCISMMWLLNFFLAEITLKQELQGKETIGKRNQGEFGHHALFHHQAVLHILLVPPLSLHLLLIIRILLLLLLILLLLLLLHEVQKASRPYLLSCWDLQGPGMSAYSPGPLLPQVPK